MYILKVLVEHNTYSLKDSFYYVSNEEVKKGSRVNITFNNQHLVGFVVETIYQDLSLEEIENNLGLKLTFIDSVIDDKPIINDELFELAIKLAKNLFVPLIGVFQAMLPKALKPQSISERNKVKIAYEEYLEYCPNENLKYTTFEKKILSKFTIFSKLPKNMFNKSKALDSLISKKVLKVIKEEKYRYKIEKIYDYHNQFKLTDLQLKVYEEIINSNDLVYLLHGVTGSGKTEIYIKLIEKTLKENKNALILVPEIALTPLMISRISSYFNEEIAVIHSSLTPVQKYDEYRKIRDNKARIVIGTRSAIFAPLSNIGLICIDEEHSKTYKDDNLSYNAIDVAILRAKYYHAKVILGSATPSIESMSKAKVGKYHEVNLVLRYQNVDLPNVELIDTKNYMNFSYKSSVFSLALIKEIKERLNKNEQVILLINKRGYSHQLMCRECGYTFKCPTCGLNLTYHKETNTLRCHHCDFKMQKPTKCPNCNSSYFSYTGIGIEKVEEDFKKIFNVPYLVLDGDRTPKTMQISTILSKFYKKEANVLIGTQIVSKGHDFDDVTLVAILDADGLLSYPSYKTNEDAFSLIVQTIGRAGRKEKRGLALIQTSNPNSSLINFAINNDYEGFYNYEILNRKRFNNPPFFNVLEIKILSKNNNLLDKYADDIYTYLKILNLPIIIHNFSFSFKNGPFFTRSMYLKYKSLEEIYQAINNLIDTFKRKSNLTLKINVNPNDY